MIKNEAIYENLFVTIVLNTFYNLLFTFYTFIHKIQKICLT